MATNGQDRSFDADSDGPVTESSPHAINARADGASVIQIEHGVTKSLLAVLWLSTFVSAAAVLGLFVVYHAFKENSAHVNVLQYDLAQMKAQLEEQGLYERTGH